MARFRFPSCWRSPLFREWLLPALLICLLATALAPRAVAQLTSDHNQFFSQEQDDITGGAERGNSFGSSIGAGDFDNDGFADIAVGLPGEDGGVGDRHLRVG